MSDNIIEKIDALFAEEAADKEFSDGLVPISAAEWKRVKDELAAVKAERGAALKDAGRYQFWRSKWNAEAFLATIANAVHQVSALKKGDDNNFDIVTDKAMEIDAAIDAAREG